MTVVLVVTLPERGHIHPLLGPAQALVDAGAEVVWSCPLDVGAQLRAAGVARVCLPAGAPAPSEALRGRALAEIIADPGALRGWIRRLLVEAPAEQVEPLRAVMREVGPDVVAIDTMAYAGAIAAELEGVPWVGWSTSLNPVVPSGWTSALIETLGALDEARHALFSRHGRTARFAVSDVLSPWGTAVFATEALVGPAPRAVRLVGPSRGGVRGGRRPDLGPHAERPLVYASFGSQAWFQPHRFDLLFRATARLGGTVVAAMGDLAEGAYPSHVVPVDYADQLAILSQADAVVTHGGANSVMESLAAGVPMLVSPICNDQPHNLRFVERAGAGVGLDLDTATVDEVTEALWRLVDPAGAPRRAAAAIAASYRAHDGAAGAAALVEEARR